MYIYIYKGIFQPYITDHENICIIILCLAPLKSTEVLTRLERNPSSKKVHLTIIHALQCHLEITFLKVSLSVLMLGCTQIAFKRLLPQEFYSTTATGRHPVGSNAQIHHW